MPLDVLIIDPATGQIDPELSANLGANGHAALFAHPDLSLTRFPLLERIRDFYSDAAYVNADLEALIGELECAATIVGLEDSARDLLGRFHSVCCLAFIRQKDVALYAD